jgi:hypothetical protein
VLDRYELATQLSVNQHRKQWYPDPLNYFEKVISEVFPWDDFIQLQFENDPLLTMSREEREWMHKVKLSRERGRDVDRHRESSRACMRKLRARKKLEALKKSIAEKKSIEEQREANAVSHQSPARRGEAEAWDTHSAQASEASHALSAPAALSSAPAALSSAPAALSSAPSEARRGELRAPKRRKRRAPRRNPAAHQKPAPCTTSATWLMSVLNENIYLALQRG